MLNEFRRYRVAGLLKKSVIVAGVAAALGATSGTAMAAPFNPFTINPTALSSLNPAGPGPYSTSVTGLGKFDGQYVETLVIGPTGTTFTSTAEMLFTGLDLATNGAPVPGTTTGLGQGTGYNIYALFTSSGTITAPGGVTTFTATSGQAQLFVDPLNPGTTFSTAPPARDAGTFGDDQLLATAILQFGQGTVNCQVAQCGSFGLIFNPTTLTALGSAYFTSPNPFYIEADLNGVFDPFPIIPSSTVSTTGSGNLFFNPIPEPASLTLLGLGLVGVARRRFRKA